MTIALRITGDEVADALLSRDPNSLLIGMVLDQQDRLEKAFAGPELIIERMGGDASRDRLELTQIAEMDLTEFVNLCAERPAIHRFPQAMAKRIHQVATVIAQDHDGDAAQVWAQASTGPQLRAALQSLPGFGEQKAKIFTALLAKQYQVAPPGWQQAAGDYGLDGYRSVADITDAASLEQVRAGKAAAKAAAKLQKQNSA